MTKKIIFSASFFYFFIIPFFFHPDIKTIFYQSHFLSEGVVNVFQYFSDNPEKAFLGSFVYPPLTYFVHGIIYPTLKVIGGSGFSEWLAMGNDAVGVQSIFRYLFLVKIFNVFALLASGVMLSRIINDKKKADIALVFLFFNPISIYVVGLMGQFDVIPALLTLVALYFSKDRPIRASVFLGLAAAMKTYPLLLLPFLAILGSKKLFEQIKIATVGALSYLIFIIPFLGTPAFFGNTLVSGLSLRLFELGFDLGRGFHLPLIPLLLASLFIYAWRGHKGKVDQLYKYFFAVTFIVVAGVDFHPQWGMWFIPFLSIIVARKINKKLFLAALLVLMIAWLGKIALFNDRFLTWGLFSVLDPGVLFLPSPYELVIDKVNPEIIQNMMRGLFAMTGGFLIIKLFNNAKN